MAACKDLRSEDRFLCSICLEVFTDPVTTPCGHNFCKSCIGQHWDTAVPHRCPLCKALFHSKPQLQTNYLLSEMAEQFRQEEEQKSSSRSSRSGSRSEEQAARAGEVSCDVCSTKAVKSCLVCLTSYCQTHLEPHLTTTNLKRHQLMEAVDNLEDRMCKKHQKPLELFCQSDQACVCMLCSVLDHSGHKFVPLREEYETKMAALGGTRSEVQQLIQERRQKIEQMKGSVKTSKEAADREKAEGVRVFTALMESVQRGLDQFKEEVEDKHKSTETQAEAFIQDLEEEIRELTKRSSELEQLSRSQDHLSFLQGLSLMKEAPPTRTWTDVSIRPPSYEGDAQRAVNKLELTLTEMMKEMKQLREAELRVLQRFEVDVTLDPDTANPQLVLSGDGKQVADGDVHKSLPDNPERFSYFLCALGKQSLSSGQFYFEVQGRGKSEWFLGMSRESVNRKGEITVCPHDGLWTLWLTNETEVYALDDSPVRLRLSSTPERVGVFADHEAGLVSFYDVEAALLLYSFTGCCFRERLFPFFCPSDGCGGKNSAPLIICAVNQSV